MATTDKARKLSRLKLRSDQLVEIHLDKMPEPPPEMIRLPGVAAWFSGMRLKEERDQQSLHRMLTQLNGRIAEAMEPAAVECTTLPGAKGDKGDPGLKGDKGDPGTPGTGGAGDSVLTWMDL